MGILYPKELIKRLTLLEEIEAGYKGVEVANAIFFAKWGDRPKYKNVFFYEPSTELIDLLELYGLGYHNENKIIQRGDVRYKETIFERNEISWTHFISVFAAQYTHDKIVKKNYLDYIIEPSLRILGVNIQKMMGELNPSLKRAYLVSFGGDVLQDVLFKTESTWDYRGDILGLSVLGNHLDLSGKLSQFIIEGYEKRHLVEDEAFRDHALYIQAKKESSSKRLNLFLRIMNSTIYDHIISGKKLNRLPIITHY